MKEIITSVDLIRKIIDIVRRFSKKDVNDKIDCWNSNKSKKILPKYYRILEIEALFRAFEIHKDNFSINLFTKNIENEEVKQEIIKNYKQKSNIQFILDGDFLVERSLLHFYPKLLKSSNIFISEFRPSITKFDQDNMNMYRIYSRLFDFRLKIENLVRVPGVPQEGLGLESSFIYYLTNHEILKEIDEILATIIVNKEVSFTKNELIVGYGFPDIDLCQIDYDYYYKGREYHDF